MTVDEKHHRYFVAKRGEVLRNIGEEFGGVVVSFPRPGVTSDKVNFVKYRPIETEPNIVMCFLWFSNRQNIIIYILVFQRDDKNYLINCFDMKQKICGYGTDNYCNRFYYHHSVTDNLTQFFTLYTS